MLKLGLERPILNEQSVTKGKYHMGFDHRDTAAINTAKAAGISFILGKTVGNSNHEVFLQTIQAPCAPNGPNHAKLLADAVEGLTRIYPGATVWVDVVCKDMPAYVQEAIDSLIGFGCLMIITHNGSSTHGNVTPLTGSLCKSVRSANTRGMVWHPLENKFVSSV